MIPDQEMAQYENQVREAELRSKEQGIQIQQQEAYFQKEDKSIVQQQLDLGEELERIDYLLRGFVLKKNEKTLEVEWTASDNPDMVVLSDYGVQLILDTIAWYLNKNTLLSNYDTETINKKMEDFSSDLNDDIFMSYEKVFMYPTLKECEEEIEKRLKHKIDIKEFANKLINKEVPRAEIESLLLKEMEGTIEREMEIIKAQKMKDKLKRFAMIMRKVQDAVHSTYLRAWKGQERTTLRQHIHISETKGNMPVIPQKGGGPLDFFRRR